MNGFSGLDRYVIKYANITASSSGDNTVVAAVAGKQIVVYQCVLMSNGTVNAKFQSGASGTDISGLFYLVANTGFAMPFSPLSWFRTAKGELLNLNLSGAESVGGVLAYVEM